MRAYRTWPILSSTLLLPGCVDYGVVPSDNGDHKPGETSNSIDTPADSAAPDTGSEGQCAGLAPPSAGPASGLPTCTPIDVSTFSLTLELSADYSTTEARGLSWPVVFPEVNGSGEIWAQDLSSGVVALRSDGSIRLRRGGLQQDLNGLALAYPRQGGALLIGIADLQGEPYDSWLRIWSPEDSTVTTGPIHATFLYPMVGDPSHSGTPWFLTDGMLLDPDGDVVSTFATQNWGYGAVFTDFEGDGRGEILNSSGVHGTDGRAYAAWSGLAEPGELPLHWLAAAVKTPDGPAVLGVDGYGAFLARPTGEVQWYYLPDPDRPTLMISDAPAIGDVTGDGYAEMCVKDAATQRRTVVTSSGHVLWSAIHPYLTEGGCSMADLDADGRYEVIEWGRNGLFVYRARDGLLLSSREDIRTLLAWNPPVIADVDADGSMEIVVTGDPMGADTFQSHLYVLGPAEGRWARGRPIWNQTTYDITSVRDDGTIISFPFPAWQTYNAFRAQPAHDGHHPDLVVVATDACATECGPGGTVRVAAQVSNLGSKDAPAGAIVRLLAWTESAGLREIATAALPDPVPSMTAATGVVLDVPWEQWGDIRVLQVDGDLADECDRVNDRVEAEAIPDPCGG